MLNSYHVELAVVLDVLNSISKSLY